MAEAKAEEERKSETRGKERLRKIVAVCEYNHKANNSENKYEGREETMNCYIKLIWANNF